MPRPHQNDAPQRKPIVLYRPNLSLTSGAGQLIRMQAEGLRAAGHRVVVACRRGALRFFLKSGIRPRRLSGRFKEHAPESGAGLFVDPGAGSPIADRGAGSSIADRGAGSLIVDHGAVLPHADIVFVHNLATEAVRHLPREDWREAAERESAFLRALRPDALIVANSRLVRNALLAHFPLDARRVVVCHPGFDARRFVVEPGRAAERRRAARKSLGLDERAPLIGLVTSGDLAKRGLGLFLTVAEEIARQRPEARFLVVGSKRLPESTAERVAALQGRLIYRPKSATPERWFAALDLFVYPAHFEEFGIVVLEALASRVPVLTSRRVGAAEILPSAYDRWLLDAPDTDALSERVLSLLGDADARERLAAAGAKCAAALDHRHYAEQTIRLIAPRAAGDAPDSISPPPAARTAPARRPRSS